MAPDQAPPANGGPQPAACQLVIRFAGPGSSEVVAIEAPGLTPNQLYLAAWLVETIARENRQGELLKAAGQGALAPGMADIVRDIMAGRPAAGRPRQ